MWIVYPQTLSKSPTAETESLYCISHIQNVMKVPLHEIYKQIKITSSPACARAVVMGRFHALRMSHKIIFWLGVIRTFKLYFSIISLNVFFILPAIRPLSTWSPQNKPPSPCGQFINGEKRMEKRKTIFIHKN